VTCRETCRPANDNDCDVREGWSPWGSEEPGSLFDAYDTDEEDEEDVECGDFR
jgi:hypothetical protein